MVFGLSLSEGFAWRLGCDIFKIRQHQLDNVAARSDVA